MFFVRLVIFTKSCSTNHQSITLNLTIFCYYKKMETGAAISIAELRKSLECPVCMETPRTGPLYQCQNGHIICSVCIKNIQECPQCRVKLPVSRIRCLLGEQQLER